MARARNIKPGFFCNEDMVELDFGTRLLFAGLWTVADREGRLEDRPKKIKINVFPADDVDVESMLVKLAAKNFIIRYEVEGDKFIQVTNWHKHQRPHHTEKESVIPFVNGEITVKEPLKPRDSRLLDGEYPPDSLIPDSLIPDTGFTDTQDVCAFACVAMKKKGMGGVNPSHPDLPILIDAGATPEHFASAAEKSLLLGKGFAYALGIVKGQMRDAAALRATPLAKPKKSYAEQQKDRIAEFTGKSTIQEVANVIAITGY